MVVYSVKQTNSLKKDCPYIPATQIKKTEKRNTIVFAWRAREDVRGLTDCLRMPRDFSCDAREMYHVRPGSGRRHAQEGILQLRGKLLYNCRQARLWLM